MTAPTPFTMLLGADDVACVDGVCIVPAATEAVVDDAPPEGV